MTTNAILSKDEVIQQADMKLTEHRRWQAVADRDSSLDGAFVFGVSSTGIFCRPSCPAKRPRRENVRFFDHALAAEQAGYRACLRCRPKAVDGNPQDALVRAVCRYIERHIEDRLTLSLLAKQFRRSPFHLQRTFKAAHADSLPRRGGRIRRREGPLLMAPCCADNGFDEPCAV